MSAHARKLSVPVFLGAVTGIVLWVYAGPLNPPPGPITSTGRFGPRTEISSLPFTINQCGSYFLTDCLTGVAGQNGITINADDVTIDLNGFALIGVPGSLDGISVPAVQHNIAIGNGTVRDWDGSGINAGSAENSRLTDLRAYMNGTTALHHGMHVGTGSRVTGCTAQDNFADGIRCQGTIRHCTAEGNGTTGIIGAGDSTIEGCSARGNKFGIQASNNSTVRGCTAEGNSLDGIGVSNGSVVIGCTSRNNTRYGISTASNCLVRDCVAWQNTADGIRVTGNCSILNNHCGNNTGDGINVEQDDCVVMNNNCTGNTAGIHLEFPVNDCRVEGNNVTDNDRGIDVDDPGNIIIKNTASGNTTNYSIDDNNKVGVIVSAPNSGAINGSTGGAGVGTTDPWANFSY